ncbi:MAG: (2Fe-2S)-binding protein [Phycisphaeraceae bacterium]|nr:(2Fe-2S)-binding protein [Phycisphaeraceae bacterium]
MPVDRCVCHDITFARLALLARRERLDLDELSARTGCGTSCGMCRPYLSRMLHEGRTSFDPMAIVPATTRPSPTQRST